MRRGIVVLAIVAIAIAAGLSYQHLGGRAADGVLRAYGTLEARNIDVGSKAGGRVVAIHTHEGAQVRAGDLLVVFDDDELRPAVALANAELAQARATLAKLEHGSRAEDIAEAEAAAASSAVPGGFRQQEMDQARAELARAKATAANAERRLVRNRELLTRGMAPQQSLDDAQADAEVARAAVTAARHALAAAEGRWQAARAATARAVNGFRVEEVDAARAEVEGARAALAAAEARLAEHEVRAPADAVVEVFDRRPGDLLLPNAIVAQLLEATQLFVMVYVPEPRVGEVALGMAVEVRVDAYPQQAFHGTVEQIRQRAEFLPRNVQTREERVHQVIGVKVRIDDQKARLRAGVYAEVRFPPAP